MGLIALEAAPAQIGAGEAERVAREVYGIAGRAQPLEGERDSNFLLESSEGRRLVLKFIDPGISADIVAGQCAVLAHVAEHAPELPVPRIVPSRDGLTCAAAAVGAGLYRVRMITCLPGRLVSTLAPGPALLCAVGRQIARLDRALRGFSHPALAQAIAWDIRHAPALSAHVADMTSSELRGLVKAALEPLPLLLPGLGGLRAQAIHNDCHPRNLLADEAGERCTGIIDLGDMIHGPLVFEPAVAMAEFLNDGLISLDGLEGLLRGYTEIQPLEREDLELLYPLIRVRIALGVLIQAGRGRSSPASDSQRLDGLAARALLQLAEAGSEYLTNRWHHVAGTRARWLRTDLQFDSVHNREPIGRPETLTESPSAAGACEFSTLLRRRRQTLGAYAELSYERPLHLVRGDGVWVYAAAGECFLDVYNNVPHVGHAHPAVVEAIACQTARIASNTRYLDGRILDYSERLLATLPAGLDTCLFVNSGSEANDVAWRIARHHTGRAGGLVMEHAYHGITEAVTALSPATTRGQSAPHVEQLAAPRSNEPGSTRADVQSATRRLESRGFEVAALMIDSALTSSGIFDPPVGWSRSIADAVHAAGGLIIGDEVQYGLGRSGSHFWGFERRGYVPDIVTLGKPVANGYPMGVVVTRRALLEKFQQETGFFSTFGGNPVACAAGLAVLEVLQREHLLENARLTGDYFVRQLRRVCGDSGRAEVRGCGLLIGVEIAELPGSPADSLTRRIVNELRQRGVLIGSEGPRANVLKLRPPMPFRPEHVDIVVEALGGVLESVGWQ